MTSNTSAQLFGLIKEYVFLTIPFLNLDLKKLIIRFKSYAVSSETRKHCLNVFYLRSI